MSVSFEQFIKDVHDWWNRCEDLREAKEALETCENRLDEFVGDIDFREIYVDRDHLQALRDRADIKATYDELEEDLDSWLDEELKPKHPNDPKYVDFVKFVGMNMDVKGTGDIWDFSNSVVCVDFPIDAANITSYDDRDRFTKELSEIVTATADLIEEESYGVEDEGEWDLNMHNLKKRMARFRMEYGVKEPEKSVNNNREIPEIGESYDVSSEDSHQTRLGE